MLPPDQPLVSICIPSYNRPEGLVRLLRSVDGRSGDFEIVVCEDHAPRRLEVCAAVDAFRRSSDLPLTYIENESNLGYDANIRELIRRSRGDFVLFMGDDDQFVRDKLDSYLAFIRGNRHLGYVLRTYLVHHPDGVVETFRYFPATTFFAPGPETYVKLFRRSVTIAGFTCKRGLADRLSTDRFDGTLLYQLYLAASITLEHPSSYCDIPVALVEQTYRTDHSFFGAAPAEREHRQPGTISPDHSVEFMKGYFRITQAIDQMHGLHSTELVRRDISKYSYPVLSIQRKRGPREFLRYVRRLNREVGLNVTPYYYLYVIGLLVAGERWTDRLIVRIKGLLGRTPQL